MYNCEDFKLARNLLLLANGKITPELVCLTHVDEPIEELPEFFPDPVLPIIQSVLRSPSDTLGIADPSKKTIRFNDKDNVKTFDAPLSENLNPKKKEPYHPKDVSEYRARTGKWWDKDEDGTNELYNLNMSLNGLCPLTNDFDQRSKTVIMKRDAIYENKITNYHLHHNPLKYLLGEFLVAKPTPFLQRFSSKIANEFKVRIEKIIDDFENERIEVYPLYYSGSRVLPSNLNFLKTRVKIIDTFLGQAK